MRLPIPRVCLVACAALTFTGCASSRLPAFEEAPVVVLQLNVASEQAARLRIAPDPWEVEAKREYLEAVAHLASEKQRRRVQRRLAAAEERFGRGVRLPKRAGQEVCSADNRVARVEANNGRWLELRLTASVAGYKPRHYFFDSAAPRSRVYPAEGRFWDESVNWARCNPGALALP